MPNHVTTRCTVAGYAEEIARFREKTIRLVTPTDDKKKPQLPVTEFDFNQIIPMPSIVKQSESSSTAEYGAELILLRSERQYGFKVRDLIPAAWMEKIRNDVAMPDERLDLVAKAYLEKHPEWEQAGRKRLQCIAETGYASWYDWAVAVWGTKWGAYDFAEVSSDPERFEFTFQTAWSFPSPVFEQLASDFPDLSFHCACYDEGSMFAGVGYFNPPDGEEPFNIVQATDELYEVVYGEKPERDEDDEEETSPQTAA